MKNKKILIVVIVILIAMIAIISIIKIKSKNKTIETVEQNLVKDVEINSETSLLNENENEDNNDVLDITTTKQEDEEEIKKETEKQEKNNTKNNEKQISSQTSFYIKVNYQANVVTIYKKDGDGNLQPYKAMICSTGSATPKSGVYNTKTKWTWGLLFGNVWGHYVTKIVGNLLFHSVPYTEKSPSSLEYWEYDKLGTSASAGCVRLQVIDSKWIFDNIPSGTPVEFYASSDVGPLGKPSSQKISSNVECRGWDPTDPDSSNPWKNYNNKTQNEKSNIIKNVMQNETNTNVNNENSTKNQEQNVVNNQIDNNINTNSMNNKNMNQITNKTTNQTVNEIANQIINPTTNQTSNEIKKEVEKITNLTNKINSTEVN